MKTETRIERLLVAMTVECRSCGAPVGEKCFGPYSFYEEPWMHYHVMRFHDALNDLSV